MNKKRYKKNKWLVKELLTDEFISNFEEWFSVFRKKEKVTFGTIILTGILKEFQRTKNPKFLGRAIRFSPDILEHPLIRLQAILWISEASQFRAKEEEINNLNQFAEGLIPKPYRAKLLDKISSSVDDPGMFKIIYDQFRKRIRQELDKMKKEKNTKKLFQGYRAEALKRLFKGHKPILNHINNKRYLVEKTFNQCCDEWAKESEPSDIAYRMLSDTFEIFFGYKIGTKNLKKLISREITRRG